MANPQGQCKKTAAPEGSSFQSSQKDGRAGATILFAPVENLNLTRSLKSPSNSLSEWGSRILLWLSTSVSLITTLGIVIVLVFEAFEFFQKVSIFEFFGSTKWAPLIEPKEFGIWPLIGGTFLIGIGACLFAIPLGAASALFLSEYLRGKRREFFKSLLEILAGIPTVVYGFFAIVFITPRLKMIFPETEVFNALSAAIVVGIMIIPTISSISQDAFQAVPRDLREAAYGLGARRYQVSTSIVFPAGLSGFVASVVLGFSRAIGETMAVTLAAGSTPRLTLNPLESIQTMTAYIVQVSMGDTPSGTIEYSSIFAVGLVLFISTLLTNIIAQFIVRKYQEKYA